MTKLSAGCARSRSGGRPAPFVESVDVDGDVVALGGRVDAHGGADGDLGAGPGEPAGESAHACWAKVRRSTTTSPAYCSEARPSWGTSYSAPWRTAHVVVPRSTSRVTVQEMSPGSSEDDSSPGAKAGGCSSSPDRSGSSSEPSCTVSVTGAGGAIVFGQSAPATERRRVWPGSSW